MPTMGEQCNALRIEIPATCRWQVATLPMEVKTFRICYFRDSSTDTVNVGIHCFLAHSVGVVYE